MQLDDLKTAWAAHGAALERSLAIDERLLREVLLTKVRRAFAPYVAWRALEVVLGVAAAGGTAAVLVAHGAEWRYLVVGGALLVFALVVTASSAYLSVNGLRLDYDGPVTAMQRDVERLRLAEYRALKWAVLGGVVLWLPAALVAFEASTGVAALARVELPWLVGNLVFGLVVLACGVAWSKRYVERADLGPRARRLVEAVSGRALRVATKQLTELARFERDETSR
ncbi:MAG: hypothetical protein K8S98_02025 [Planctomycetes bacterium]|nr:hypothetical protein [Planctomycetota bacterium]